MEIFDLDRNAFQDWLARQASDVMVGMSDSCTSCPIATWYRETKEPVSISADTIVLVESGDEFATPDWVEWFVHGIDERHADEGTGANDYEFLYRNEAVLARECLEVLSEIPI